MRFDLLIKGGEVVDPGAGQVDKFDVAINRNRISAVDSNIPVESAFRVIDASNQFVTPGLIDLHTHVYHGVGVYGIYADSVASRSGVTTWLDAGSAGAFNFPGFRKFIVNPSQARIYALLNVSSIGMMSWSWELSNLNYCDVDLCCKIINLNRDIVLGVKARIDKNTTSGLGLEPLRLARDVANRCELPLMVHIGSGPPEILDVLEFLKPNDILTHCFTGGSMKITDNSGFLRDEVKKVWDSGVIFDIGHGAGSFSFETAEALMSEGYKPDVISSDIHQLSINGPMFDMPTCLSKFMLLGMSFSEVIYASTRHPAQVMGLKHEIGTLKPGALADVALFRIESGVFPFYDVCMNQKTGKKLVRNTLTIINGRELPITSDPLKAPWIELNDNQRELIERGHTPQALDADSIAR